MGTKIVVKREDNRLAMDAEDRTIMSEVFYQNDQKQTHYLAISIQGEQQVGEFMRFIEKTGWPNNGPTVILDLKRVWEDIRNIK